MSILGPVFSNSLINLDLSYFSGGLSDGTSR